MNTIEINGKKYEVSEEQAKLQQVQTLAVGTKCKILVKEYDSTKVYPGVVAAIDLFKDKPTASVLYLKASYNTAEICFAYLHEGSTCDVVVASEQDSICWDIPFIEKTLRDGIDKKRLELEDLQQKLAFIRNTAAKHGL